MNKENQCWEYTHDDFLDEEDTKEEEKLALKNKNKRAMRRHHKKRLKNKRKHYYDNWLNKPTLTPKEEVSLGCMIDTPKRCTCSFCANPRRFFGAKSYHEQKDSIRVKEELDEWDL